MRVIVVTFMIIFLAVSLVPALCIHVPAATAEQNNTAQCTIQTEKTIWRKSEETVLIVKLDLHGTFSEKTLASLHLTPVNPNLYHRNEYWAPFSMETGSVAASWEKLNPQASGQIGPVELHPYKLLWGPSISSVWPAQRLFEMTAAGKYRLYVEVNTKNSTLCRSNEIIITMKR